MRQCIIQGTKKNNEVKQEFGPELPNVSERSAQIVETNVPLPWIAKQLNISPVKLREMIKARIFTFGTYSIVNDRACYYCSSKLLYEQRGIIYLAGKE